MLRCVAPCSAEDGYLWQQRLEDDGPKLAAIAARGFQKVRLEYRQNRMVCFDSSLFHRTEYPLSFKRGWHNRRINLTYLFGSHDSRPRWPYQSRYGVEVPPTPRERALRGSRPLLPLAGGGDGGTGAAGDDAESKKSEQSEAQPGASCNALAA